ncbi:hypothetical protein, partial [Streptomyces spongiae]|uniref:hypothetical protein n=1 Tax=Streptomyces spongiae TaxID=565072 RepID=UPI001D14B94E
AAQLSACPGLVARMRAAGIGVDEGTGVRKLVDALAAVAKRLPAGCPQGAELSTVMELSTGCDAFRPPVVTSSQVDVRARARWSE